MAAGYNLTDDQKARIIELRLKHDLESDDIASRFGISRHAVNKIVRDAKRRKDIAA